MNKNSILCVGAHPDDEIACAGTLINYSRAGHKVMILTMTDGGMGHMTLSSEELIKVRSIEAENAAKVLGAELYFAGYKDSAVQYSRDDAIEMVKWLRSLRPDILITHPSDSLHPDHRHTSFLLTDAFYLCSLPLLKTEQEPLPLKTGYFFADAGEADTFVDITQAMDSKLEAARCHKSQYDEWLVEHDSGIDQGNRSSWEEDFRRSSAFKGFHCGVKYAEAFKSFVPKMQKAQVLGLG